jgi:hypothetical protein
MCKKARQNDYPNRGVEKSSGAGCRVKLFAGEGISDFSR